MFNPRLLVSQRSKFAKTALALFLVFLFLPLSASAQDVPSIQTVFAGSPLGTASLSEIIVNFVRVFFALLGFVALFLFLYGGYVWMTSQGDPEKIKRAKQIMYNAVVGLIIIFSAFAIATFVLNLLRGATGGGGGGGTNIPGGSGDWSRSAIGAGPIQSVYPKPNQTNVPINTRIAVTFKENIKPESICTSPAGSYCNGEIINNIEICELEDDGDKCKADSQFTTTTFAGATVSQVTSDDFKTFIINTNNNYLGSEDNRSRPFKVLLKQGIMSASTGKSIFDGLRVPYYHWSFKTNGFLDLTPPEIAKIGLYPNPDLVPGGADEYAAGTAATAGNLTITVTATGPIAEQPVTITNKTNQPVPVIGTLKDIPIKPAQGFTPGFEVYFNGTIASPAGNTAEFGFTVLTASQAKVSQTVKNNFPSLPWETCSDGSGALCLKITGGNTINTNAGFSLNAGGAFQSGGSWSFTVAKASAGKTLTFTDGSATKKFVFAKSAFYKEGDKITRTIALPGGDTASESYDVIIDGTNAVVAANIAKVLNAELGSKLTATTTGNVVTVTAKNAGANQMSLATDATNLTGAGSLSGAEKEIGWTVKPLGSKLKDPYNNSSIRITFTEPINPINIVNFITVKKDGAVVSPADYNVSLTNQYRTIELSPKKVCGVNACGQEITCWLDPSTTAPASTPIEVSLKAATLRYCEDGDQTATANDWCEKWGGACNSTTNNGRCQYPTSGFNYPQAHTTPGGLTDMSNNSFNGNFNKTTNPKGQTVGNAEGQTGTTGPGQSSFGLPFFANDHLNGDNIFGYEPATFNNSGDDFKWSFYMSNQIDNVSPLISKVIPTGNQAYGQGNGEKFSDPIRFVFDRLMNYSSIKPGYGYGANQQDFLWHVRYLLIKTLTTAANPVGYWVSSRDIDYDGDGLADYTTADLEHNTFDQSVSYGPLAGNGLRSITQNCFLPGNGPQNAGDAGATVVGGAEPNNCSYGIGGETSGCVTDSAIDENKRVLPTNPASYGYMNCNQVDGAVACNKQCKIHTATSTDSANGSWVITKDHPTITDTATGKTGCCFGVCK